MVQKTKLLNVDYVLVLDWSKRMGHLICLVLRACLRESIALLLLGCLGTALVQDWIMRAALVQRSVLVSLDYRWVCTGTRGFCWRS